MGPALGVIPDLILNLITYYIPYRPCTQADTWPDTRVDNLPYTLWACTQADTWPDTRVDNLPYTLWACTQADTWPDTRVDNLPYTL